MDSADSDDDTLPVAVPLDDAHADKPAPEQPKKPVPVTLITGALAVELLEANGTAVNVCLSGL